MMLLRKCGSLSTGSVFSQMPSLEQRLLEYETKLMDPAVRRSEKAAEFIADDFMEFAGNGRIFTNLTHW